MKWLLLAGVPVVVAMAAARHSFEDASTGKHLLTQTVNAPFIPLSAHAAAPATPKALMTAAVSKPATALPATRSASQKKTTSALSTTTAAQPARREDARRAGQPRRLVSTEPAVSNRAPAAGTSAAAKSAPAPAYERRVADAATLSSEDLDRAARRLEIITMEDPARPAAFETLAAIRLRQGDYYQAYEMFDAALRNGGKATFSIMHNHGRGNFGSGHGATCVGALTLSPSQVTFEGADGHRFTASWADLQDAGPNRFVGSRIGGFHVKLTVAGRSQNFNLAPSSRDEREARILFDLLTANILRQDSGATQR